MGFPLLAAAAALFGLGSHHPLPDIDFVARPRGGKRQKTTARQFAKRVLRRRERNRVARTERRRQRRVARGMRP